MEPELRANLLACAHAFAATRKLELVTVARLAAGDWRFFERIDDGKTFTARKYDDVILWFAENWPEAAVWPGQVERPSARKREAA